jgi:hypothetical protein
MPRSIVVAFFRRHKSFDASEQLFFRHRTERNALGLIVFGDNLFRRLAVCR